jgi:hypothetical protein
MPGTAKGGKKKDHEPPATPTPEPGTLLLVGLGAGIAGARRLRRK